MKRSCRRTPDENRIHDKAVKLRKMTDEQLVKYVEGQSDKKQEPVQGVKISVTEIMNEISEIKGVGKTKLHYIRGILEKKLEGANA